MILSSLASKAQDTLTFKERIQYSGFNLSMSANMYAVGGTLAMGGIGLILIGDKLGYQGIEDLGGVLTITSFPFIIIGLNLQKKSGEILIKE